jgi:hypothetical protein
MNESTARPAVRLVNAWDIQPGMQIWSNRLGEILGTVIDASSRSYTVLRPSGKVETTRDARRAYVVI